MTNPKVVDADGHIYENNEEIEEYFEAEYSGMRRARTYSLFPSLDGWPRGLGVGRPDKVTETKPEDVIEFVERMGLESTVLYPTAALAIGLVQSPSWAKAISRAYNAWFHDRFSKKDARLKGVACLPIQDPEAAVAELRYAVEELGMVGGFLPSATVLKQGIRTPRLSSDLCRSRAPWVSSWRAWCTEPRIRIRLLRRPRPGTRSRTPFSFDDSIHEYGL